ncbi:hypothetical protein Lal_00004853 [Lupinus albus]|nr:hypothetical protein Lal_00004853 [Lupinus albus]
MNRIPKYINGAPGKNLVTNITITLRLLDTQMLIRQVPYCLVIKDPLEGQETKCAKYRSIASITYKFTLLKLVKELQFIEIMQIALICNHQCAFHIACNPIFHEKTKHIDIDCYFIGQQLHLKTSLITLSTQMPPSIEAKSTKKHCQIWNLGTYAFLNDTKLSREQ